jgi:hypothetical protein
MSDQESKPQFVWQYLKDAPIQECHFSSVAISGEMGMLTERLAVAMLRKKIVKEHWGDNFFSDKASSIGLAYPDNGAKLMKTRTGRIVAKGLVADLLAIYNCITFDGKGCKNVVAFEVKSGVPQIVAKQFNMYIDFLKNPASFVPKAHESKVFYLWVLGRDFQAGNLYYTLKEMRLDEIPNFRGKERAIKTD